MIVLKIFSYSLTYLFIYLFKFHSKFSKTLQWQICWRALFGNTHCYLKQFDVVENFRKKTSK